MIKGSIQQGDLIFVNIYTPSIGTAKYIKQILTNLKGDFDSNTIIVGNLKIPLTSMGISSRQK